MVADLYLQFRTRTETALSALLKLAADMQREPGMLDTLQNLLQDVREPLLFVVMGEVKAGKSTLLNALFGQEFCKVDVLPATDRIYIFQIRRARRNSRCFGANHGALSADRIPT